MSNKKSYNANKKASNKKSYYRNDKKGRQEATTSKCEPALDAAMKGRTPMDDIKSNDISWYNRSPLYPLATRLPWNQVMGANTERQYPSTNANVSYGYSTSQPGLMTIDFAPTIGWAADMNSAVNRAFNQLYADIVAHTSGALQMQQMELAVMTLGVSSLACHIGYTKKVLGAYQNYSSLNYYLPAPLVRAMGFDPEDLVKNAADYQIRLTDLITRFNRLAIPNFSDLHVRQYALAHNLYSDSESVFGQIINFRPQYIYKFDDINHSLDPIKVFDDGDEWSIITLGEYMDKILECLAQWENSSVTPIVAGNVRRAYPDGSLVKIDPFDPTHRVIPVVDRNITWQVNNMRWHAVQDESLRVTQDPVSNILICKPKWAIEGSEQKQAARMNYYVLNSFDGNTSDEFVMEATRLLPIITSPEDPHNSSSYVSLLDCSSELVTRVTVFNRVMNANGVAQLTPYTLRDSEIAISKNSEELYKYVTALGLLSKWRNGPALTVNILDDGGNYTISPFPVDSREINMFTHIHQDQLEVLHLAAAQSLFWATGFVPGKQG